MKFKKIDWTKSMRLREDLNTALNFQKNRDVVGDEEINIAEGDRKYADDGFFPHFRDLKKDPHLSDMLRQAKNQAQRHGADGRNSWVELTTLFRD